MVFSRSWVFLKDVSEESQHHIIGQQINRIIYLWPYYVKLPILITSLNYAASRQQNLNWNGDWKIFCEESTKLSHLLCWLQFLTWCKKARIPSLPYQEENLQKFLIKHLDYLLGCKWPCAQKLFWYVAVQPRFLWKRHCVMFFSSSFWWRLFRPLWDGMRNEC